MTRPAAPSSKPRLVLVTTGGTVASAAASRGATTGYTIGEGGPEALLGAVPEVRDIADIAAERFCNVSSADMMPALVLDLTRRLTVLLDRPDLNGAVVTHGTDTMEDTAWLLHLLLPPGKPVVLTGAMRPGSALGADGPMNLLAATLVAADPAARGRGVLVAMNDRVHGARLVRKAHPTAPDAFHGGEQGIVAGGRVVFTASPDLAGPPRFDPARLGALPRVEILAAYPGAETGLIEAACASGAAGLVVACTGNGSLSTPWRAALEAAVAGGLAVVRASRTGDGAVCWEGLPGVPAGVHSPNKARILLCLALATGLDPRDAFAAY